MDLCIRCRLSRNTSWRALRACTASLRREGTLRACTASLPLPPDTSPLVVPVVTTCDRLFYFTSRIARLSTST